jgi:hypothetical protein
VPNLNRYHGIGKGALFWQCHPLGLNLTLKKSHGQLSGGGILKHYKAVLLALLPTLVASTLIILFSEMLKSFKKNLNKKIVKQKY